MGRPDGHDAPERIDSPYPRPPQDEAPIVRTRQFGWALSCIIFYPIVSFLMLALDESVTVAMAVASPFIITYYCASALRTWPLRIFTGVTVLGVCWLISESLLTIVAQAR